MGWDDRSVGKKMEKKEDVELDDIFTEGEEADDLGQDEEKPKKAKTKKKPKEGKPKKKATKKKPKEAEDDLDDFFLEYDENDDPVEPKKPPTKKRVKKTKKVEPEDDLGLDDAPWEEEAGDPKKVGKTKAEEVAESLSIDLSSECPVCRSLEACECEEEDRAFTRRVRFAADVKDVARCPRCQAPHSVLHLPRPGSGPGPYRLSQFVPVWGCAVCHPTALATVLLAQGRGR